MNTISNEVISFRGVHVSETGSSSTMVKGGLIQALKEVSSSGIQIKTLTTDRHIQKKKYVREQTNIRPPHRKVVYKN